MKFVLLDVIFIVVAFIWLEIKRKQCKLQMGPAYFETSNEFTEMHKVETLIYVM